MSEDKDHSEVRKRVIFEKGTEAPNSGALLHNSKDGDYLCGNCGAKLFESSAKYDSQTPGLIGWPSFDSAVEGAIKELEDKSLWMNRTETVCANCDAHLGHVFPADDAATGTHYCINSASIDFMGEDGGMIKGDGSE